MSLSDRVSILVCSSFVAQNSFTYEITMLLNFPNLGSGAELSMFLLLVMRSANLKVLCRVSAYFSITLLSINTYFMEFLIYKEACFILSFLLLFFFLCVLSSKRHYFELKGVGSKETVVLRR